MLFKNIPEKQLSYGLGGTRNIFVNIRLSLASVNNKLTFRIRSEGKRILLSKFNTAGWSRQEGTELPNEAEFSESEYEQWTSKPPTISMRRTPPPQLSWCFSPFGWNPEKTTVECLPFHMSSICWTQSPTAKSEELSLSVLSPPQTITHISLAPL